MKYFTLEELTRSAVATARGIPNVPGENERESLEVLVLALLDPLREIWGAPIYVNSGYRSPELNKAVGGVSNSQHMKGQAADITTGNTASNRKLFALIRDGGFDFDQLIDEANGTWIHVSYVSPSENRRQVLKY